MSAMQEAKRDKPKFKVIGVSGLMGSGKDYVALNLLKPALGPNVLILALADHFKVQICSHELVPFEKVFGDARDEETRKKLQRAGTEEGRLKIRESVWIDTLECWMRLHGARGVDTFIVTDVRFRNEVEWIKSLGGHVIRLVAPARTWIRAMREAKDNEAAANKLLEHPSETALTAVLADSRQTLIDCFVPNNPGDEKACARAVETFIAKYIARRDAVLGDD